MALYRATCVTIGSKGVLIEGPSGSGKSDLALRLIAVGAKLVADDYVELSARRGGLFAEPPQALAGRIEVRGLGLMEVSYIPRAKIHLVVKLVPRARVPRLPGKRARAFAGIRVPLVTLHPFDASTPDKIRLALGRR